MPELPEVETIRQDLEKIIIGKKIDEIFVFTPKAFRGAKEAVVRRSIVAADRAGKMLFFELDDGSYLVCHLKLTGQLIYQNPKPKTQNTKFNRVIIIFEDKSKLFFNDLRKFGWFAVMSKEEAEKEKAKLGLDPLADDFNQSAFKGLLAQSPQKRIRDFLLDQQKIAGIGNIYASEILYCAGILPNRRIKEITEKELAKLYQCLKKILLLALKMHGASDNTYCRPDGRRGDYMKKAMVYHQKKCPRGHPVRREKISGRSAFYCGICQK